MSPQVTYFVGHLEGRDQQGEPQAKHTAERQE
jgi:hypothetical protein